MDKQAGKRETKIPKEDVAQMAKKQIDTAKLESTLMPFAEWAWGDKETAKTVVQKYFKQVINK